MDDDRSGDVEYRVEAIPWKGHTTGASHLEQLLNEFAAEGWEIVAILPTTAGTSIRSLVSAQASADTTEFAVVLRRDPPHRGSRRSPPR